MHGGQRRQPHRQADAGSGHSNKISDSRAIFFKLLVSLLLFF